MKRVILFFLSVISGINGLSAQEKVLWKFKTEGRIYSSPISDDQNIYVGSGDFNFYAIEKSSGKEVWRFETKGAVHSSPSLYIENVFFGSADGSLYAVNRQDGSLKWKFKSKGEKSYDLWDYYLSSPIISEGIIYWGSGDGNIYAINVDSGKLMWKFTTGDIVHASPVVDDEKLYFGGFDGYFYALNKKNGNLIWKFNTIGATYFPKGEVQKGTLLHGNTLFFGSRDYNIYALDAVNGAGKWNMRDEGGWIISEPIDYKGNVYFGTSDAHVFYCMDAKSGQLKWKAPLNMRVYGAAVAKNDIIYFGCFNGKIYGLDYLNGEIKWEFQTDASKENYASVYGKDGHFKEDFVLYSEDLTVGENAIHSLGSILSTPLVEDQMIYFGSSDGKLYAVELPENEI
ncbi:PQQ-binding-like beta-propeller repeat protein [Xanthovirga aplysinae]|uniref:outer membrane protein assembly factor BamB family protein n=1 Tax=Xanthovirga aplysinae TaxID=2529853 RepID=UPI0012BBD6F6|nr:PQQ-binding-like beta-propeller repeat protein [Xanthovirga aplysinae]MTI31396.1 hypothetical protein [Xanthovirga aplysinae]